MTNIKRFQVEQRARNSIQSVVRDRARTQTERLQLEQTLADVDQRLVTDFITETNIQRANCGCRNYRCTIIIIIIIVIINIIVITITIHRLTGIGQIVHSDVADIITGAQIQLRQFWHLGEILETAVRYRDAKAQVDRLERGQALANVFQGNVGQPLAVLQRQVLQVRRALG